MQHHIQNKSKFLPWYLIKVEMSLNALLKLHETKNAGGILVKPAPKKIKNYHH